MKHIVSILCLGLFFAAHLYAQSPSDTKAVTKAIHDFAKAGDRQDVASLEQLLDSNYRVVMNQLFGSEGAAVLPREAYLQKIRNKEFGGDKRKVTIEDLQINGKNASAKVTLAGSKMTMVSFFQLICNKDGEWKLIQDLPTVI